MIVPSVASLLKINEIGDEFRNLLFYFGAEIKGISGTVSLNGATSRRCLNRKEPTRRDIALIAERSTLPVPSAEKAGKIRTRGSIHPETVANMNWDDRLP